MTDILDMIHDMKKKGFSDQKILKKVKHKLIKYDFIKNQRGGKIDLSRENAQVIRDQLAEITDRKILKDQSFFEKIDKLLETLSSNDFIDENDVITQLQQAIDNYKSAKSKMKPIDTFAKNKSEVANDDNTEEINTDDIDTNTEETDTKYNTDTEGIDTNIEETDTKYNTNEIKINTEDILTDDNKATRANDADAKATDIAVIQTENSDANIEDNNTVEITVDDMKVANTLPKKSNSFTDAKNQIETIESAIKESKEKENEMVYVSVFDKINEGTILYFPSNDISRFNNSNLIFVNLKKVIDRNNKRSFTMFFTENKAYAFMFGGISSLNKREVFIHQFRVKETIYGIKRIHPNILPKDVDNVADGFCGVTEDGRINGIKIERRTNGQNINEYYLCDPESKLTHIKTYIQISDTEFVPYTEEDIVRSNLPANDADENRKIGMQIGFIDSDDKQIGRI